MKTKLRLAIAQINCTVGDLAGNVRKITDHLGKAEALGADIVSFPELAITGYPPEDLLLKPSFVEDNISALDKVVKSVGNIVAVGYFFTITFLSASSDSSSVHKRQSSFSNLNHLSAVSGVIFLTELIYLSFFLQ